MAELMVSLPEPPRKDGQLVDKDQLSTEEEMAYEAYQLLQRGLSWMQIADQVGYANAKTAEVCVRQYLQVAAMDMAQERRQEVLQLQTDRINALINATWDAAMNGDTRAADFCLRAISTVSKLYGLEALHEKTGQSTKTIVIAGSSEQYSQALQAIAEEN